LTAVEQQTLSFVEAAGGNHRQKLVEDTKVAAISEKTTVSYGPFAQIFSAMHSPMERRPNPCG
jgi:hypothetical protein